MIFRWLATAFGLLMVAATGVPSHHGPAFVAALLALGAVAVGVVFRAAATLAVLLALAAIAFTDPTPILAAVSGLAATLYLVLRHATGHVVTASAPTLGAAFGFTIVGLAATSFPLQLPWLPLVAPLAVLGIFLLATRPFLRDHE
ncbi:MAG: hypothetical protein WA317_04505 [Mycobacterium sp.]|uniref:hypothetical protein n=1 Tax=Mycobacterium sp. TaxID=1785 RepID=UPI003CC5E0F0